MTTPARPVRDPHDDIFDRLRAQTTTVPTRSDNEHDETFNDLRQVAGATSIRPDATSVRRPRRDPLVPLSISETAGGVSRDVLGGFAQAALDIAETPITLGDLLGLGPINAPGPVGAVSEGARRIMDSSPVRSLRGLIQRKRDEYEAYWGKPRGPGTAVHGAARLLAPLAVGAASGRAAATVEDNIRREVIKHRLYDIRNAAYELSRGPKRALTRLGEDVYAGRYSALDRVLSSRGWLFHGSQSPAEVAVLGPETSLSVFDELGQAFRMSSRPHIAKRFAYPDQRPLFQVFLDPLAPRTRLSSRREFLNVQREVDSRMRYLLSGGRPVRWESPYTVTYIDDAGTEVRIPERDWDRILGRRYFTQEEFDDIMDELRIDPSVNKVLGGDDPEHLLRLQTIDEVMQRTPIVDARMFGSWQSRYGRRAYRDWPARNLGVAKTEQQVAVNDPSVVNTLKLWLTRKIYHHIPYRPIDPLRGFRGTLLSTTRLRNALPYSVKLEPELSARKLAMIAQRDVNASEYIRRYHELRDKIRNLLEQRDLPLEQVSPTEWRMRGSRRSR